MAKRSGPSPGDEGRGARGRRRAGLTYGDAGVSIERGDEVVARIRSAVRSTYDDRVLAESHGGFAGLMALYENAAARRALPDPVLVGATDGVGTKLKVAFLLDRFDTVGIDLVAMCVNDLVVTGARPLFFLDYVATAELRPRAVEEVVRGVARGCRDAGCVLLGGETAEMPGFYKKGELDLAGFTVGVVDRKRIIDGRRVKAGDALIGLPSSGLHSNGFSLVRRVLVRGGKRALERRVPELGRTLGEELLEPTRIYVRPVLSLLERYRERNPIRALAHITGGGLVENIPRVLPAGMGAVIERGAWTVPPIFELIRRRGRIARKEMDRVFNFGLGMVLVVSRRSSERVVSHLRELGEEASIVGEVVEGRRRVRFV